MTLGSEALCVFRLETGAKPPRRRNDPPPFQAVRRPEEITDRPGRTGIPRFDSDFTIGEDVSAPGRMKYGANRILEGLHD